VLFYNAGDGSAATAVVDSKGQYNFKKSLDPLSTGWTHITSVGRHGLFFYNSRTGKAATALLDGAGNFTKCENLVGFGQWTHVVGSVTGRMLFYNSSTGGTGATATVDASGHYAFAQSIGGFARGWSHIVAVGAGLLFYNSSNQTGATGSIDDSGDFVSGENLDLDRWTDVVGLRNGSIFFYKFGNTAADPPLGATAAIDKDGHYVAHQTFPLFADFPPFPTSPWSWITAVSS
jgi:hypothetical protein